MADGSRTIAPPPRWGVGLDSEAIVEGVVFRDNNVSLTGIGGAIEVREARLDLRRSLLTANQAGRGAGVSARTATVLITNSTIAGNVGGGSGTAVALLDSVAVIRQSTIAANRSDWPRAHNVGIWMYGSKLTLSGSIVAGNTYSGQESISGPYPGEQIEIVGTPLYDTAEIVTDGSNVIGSDGVAGFAVDPALAHLTRGTPLPSETPAAAFAAIASGTVSVVGGGLPVLALPAGSPALDRVPAAVCRATSGAAGVEPVDQRGWLRLRDNPQRCDAGAFEVGAVKPRSALPPGVIELVPILQLLLEDEQRADASRCCGYPPLGRSERSVDSWGTTRPAVAARRRTPVQ